MTSRSPWFPRRAAVCLLCTGVLRASGVEFPGLPNFQKVNDEVYRGAQPTELGFKSLARLGIKTVIDLRQIGEHSQADEEKAVQGNGMRYVSVPMKGMSTPTSLQVSAVLALLEDAAAGPVFVHCRRGADRTGTVIACYRISHDHWETEKALSEARSYGMSWFERAMQTYVLRFEPASVQIEASGHPSVASR
jgi:tyrosine-protein phosphatase SIW14